MPKLTVKLTHRRTGQMAGWLVSLVVLVGPAMAQQEGQVPGALPDTELPTVGELVIGAVSQTHPPIIGSRATPAVVRQQIVNIYDSQAELQVVLRRSRLIITRFNVTKTHIVSPRIADVLQISPREISIMGQELGATNMTFWFEDEAQEPLSLLVRVVPDPDLEIRREEQLDIMENLINELFPNSKVQLFPLGDRVIVKGQARDARDAAQILAVLRGDGRRALSRQSGQYDDRLDNIGAGQTAAGQDRILGRGVGEIVNMLMVPGVQQVALKVKVAELNRSALRRFGVDLDFNIQNKLFIRSLLSGGANGGASIRGSFDAGDVQFFINFLEQKGLVRLLAEPTVVTMSGTSASFVAGGEFAVPTVVGVNGAQAVTTDFRAFGSILSILPTIMDKDHFRLQISAEFSSINQGLANNAGTPGLNTRAVSTNVEMREGQTLAIAGLLSDSLNADKSSDLPWIGEILGLRHMKREETELIVLVTPELVHPMEPEEVPPLPGFDVHEPTWWEFNALGRIEGRPDRDYRSTVWPSLRSRFRQAGWVGGGTGSSESNGYSDSSGHGEYGTPGCRGCSSCTGSHPGWEVGPGNTGPGYSISGPYGHSDR